jgi:nucleotide-binding universal stress UspA family protein
MTYVVPFDNSEYSRVALVKAEAIATAVGDDLVAIAVVPEDKSYLQEKGWIETGEDVDVDTIVGRLRQNVERLVDSARFRAIHIEGHVRQGTISGRIKDVAKDEGADVVVIGSENAGKVTTPISSVGGTVASDDEYDVFIVRCLPEESSAWSTGD